MTVHANPLTKGVIVSPPLSSATFPASDLQVFLTGLRHLGYDTDTLLAAAGISQENLRHPDARIACDACGAFFTCAQQQRLTPNLALELARITPLGAWPLLDYLVLTTDTVGAGVHQLARYFRLTGSPIELTTREDGDPIEINLTGISPFAVEYSAALLVLHFRTETEGRFAASSISFEHVPDDPSAVERVLGCPVQARAASNRVTVLTESWRLPLRRRDPVLREMLERHADAILEQMPRRSVLSPTCSAFWWGE